MWEQLSATWPLSEMRCLRGSCCFTIFSIGLGLWMLVLRINLHRPYTPVRSGAKNILTLIFFDRPFQTRL